MAFIHRALSVDEELEAVELLNASGPRTLVFARGVFAGAAVSPRPLDPTEWLPVVVGDQIPDSLTLKRLLTLLVRDAGAVSRDLAAGKSVTPVSEDEDVIREFCKGFVRVAQKEASWTTNQAAFDLTLPIMVLSGYVETTSLTAVNPEAARDPTAYLKSCSERLPHAVAALYDFFAEARGKNAEISAEISNQKVGRNEPCPCGSGKKYKKCCGL